MNIGTSFFTRSLSRKLRPRRGGGGVSISTRLARLSLTEEEASRRRRASGVDCTKKAISAAGSYADGMTARHDAVTCGIAIDKKRSPFVRTTYRSACSDGRNAGSDRSAIGAPREIARGGGVRGEGLGVRESRRTGNGLGQTSYARMHAGRPSRRHPCPATRRVSSG